MSWKGGEGGESRLVKIFRSKTKGKRTAWDTMGQIMRTKLVRADVAQRARLESEHGSI
jgi:hypothetical protein